MPVSNTKLLAYCAIIEPPYLTIDQHYPAQGRIYTDLTLPSPEGDTDHHYKAQVMTLTPRYPAQEMRQTTTSQPRSGY
jgi:hypothetical protein